MDCMLASIICSLVTQNRWLDSTSGRHRIVEKELSLFMADMSTLKPGYWSGGKLPANVALGQNSIITGDNAFKRFGSKQENALTIGQHCTLNGIQFSTGENGVIEIGDYCSFTNVILMCELAFKIGSYVIIGWNCSIADSDFHPVAPAARVRDAIAVSPLGNTRDRPEILCKPIEIGDDVWIGPNATILKGVTIGSGSFVEPGSIITKDIPPRSRVRGNPAQIVGQL